VPEFALTLVLADLFDVYDDKPDEAARIWIRSLQLPETFISSSRELKYLHSLVGRTYGMHLIRRAFDARVGTDESNQFIKALEDVCVSNEGMGDTIPDYSALPLQNLILAVWNKSVGKHEEAAAVLRPFMQTATSGVYEDSGLGAPIVNFVIARILIAMGDEARGVALMRTYSTPGVINTLCYGRCGLLPDRWIGGYSSSTCLTDLCCDCGEVLKQRKRLPINVCGPEHSLVSVPNREDLPQGKAYFNDELVPITQIYSDIRQIW